MPRRGENVYHRKDGLWEARYVKEIDAFGRKKYGSVYGHTCKEVKEKRQQVCDQILLFQRPIATRNMTVSQLVDEWIKLNRHRLKPTTLQRYAGLYNKHIKGPLGKLPVLYFTTVSINDFAIERLNTGLSPQTVNGILVFLHTCLKYGHRQYRLPLPEIIYLTPNKKEMRVLSIEEQRRLTDFLLQDLDIYKFGVVLALYTGLRIGELCALQWSDVANGRIKVQRTMQRVQRTDGNGTELYIGEPKTQSSSREIPIPSFLTEQIEQFRDETQQYVLGTRFMRIVEPRTMQNKFKRYLSAVNIDGATFHTLRHSFASRCVEAGFDIKSLSEILGHSDVKVSLNRYVHSSFSLKVDNMEKLQAIW